MPLVYGNTDNLRHMLREACRSVHLGDSTATPLPQAIQRCFRPVRWKGILTTANFQSADGNLAMGPFVAMTGVFTKDESDPFWFAFTADGDALDPTSPYGAGPYQVRASGLTASQNMLRADVWRAALAAGKTVRVKSATRRHPDGEDGRWFLAAYTDFNTVADRSPNSGGITANGDGEVDIWSVDVTGQLPDTTTWNMVTWSGPAGATTPGEVLEVFQGFHVSIVEDVGFEYANIAVGGTSLEGWSATDGVVTDATMGAIVDLFDPTLFLIQLGANVTPSADYVARCVDLMERLRGFVPGCRLVFLSPYEVERGVFGNTTTSRLARIAALAQDVADADPLGLTTVLDMYTVMGPKEFNRVTTGSGSDFVQKFGTDGDDTHFSSESFGAARYATELNALVQQGADSTDGLAAQVAAVAAQTAAAILQTPANKLRTNAGGRAEADVREVLGQVPETIEEGEIGGGAGPGADQVTLTVTVDGAPVADADVWVTSDAAGATTVAGTLQTDSAGKVLFLLDNGVTYYLWMQKDGVNPIRGQAFVAEAD